MPKNFLDGFEQVFLFNLTRLLCLCAVFVLLAIIIVGGLVVRSNFESSNTTVSASEVISSVKPAVQSVGEERKHTPLEEMPATAPEKPLRLSFVLQKYFATPENLDILKGWLKALPDDEVDPFLNELSAVIEEAEKSNVDVYEALNKYGEIKFARIEKNKKDAEQRNTFIIWYAAAAGTSLVLIAQLSLILVLLAVERNTRKVALP